MPTDRWFALAALALLTSSATALAGCAASPDGTSQDGTSDDELTYDGHSYRWIYAGTLPHLTQPSIDVSLTAHTARVTGYLPQGYDESKLPFYATKVGEDGDAMGTKISVVYPVATGEATNAPGDYSQIRGVAFVPTNDHAPWGGFPFLAYNYARGIAFHGPITHDDSQWKLIRGPVSHGCNRMQGEHVTELAHLIGIDMTKPHLPSDVYPESVKVHVAAAYDTLNGKYVDVDYPAQTSVKLPPAAQSVRYPIWDSDDFPRLVCKYNAKIPLGPHHCDYAGQNKYDLFTGK